VALWHPPRRRWGLAVDIAGTVFLTWLLAGTYSGAAAALLGGGLLSVTLLMIRRHDERREHRRSSPDQHRASPFAPGARRQTP